MKIKPRYYEYFTGEQTIVFSHKDNKSTKEVTYSNCIYNMGHTVSSLPFIDPMKILFIESTIGRFLSDEHNILAKIQKKWNSEPIQVFM